MTHPAKQIAVEPVVVAPRCEQCGRPEEDWPDFHLNEADICSACTTAEGIQHHAPYVDRALWWATGGHCLCRECAPPRPTNPCDLCQRVSAVDGLTLCAQCSVEVAADYAAAERERVTIWTREVAKLPELGSQRYAPPFEPYPAYLAAQPHSANCPCPTCAAKQAAQLDYTEARANEELDARDAALRKSWGEK